MEKAERIAEKIGEICRKKRSVRAAIAAGVLLIGAAGMLYAYFNTPGKYPFTCTFYLLTGLYCPGCGSGRALYAALHGQIREAFCWNPVMMILLPFLGLYVAARATDWVITGGNHIDRHISVKMLLAVLAVVLIYGILRNISAYPFCLLAPGGLIK